LRGGAGEQREPCRHVNLTIKRTNGKGGETGCKRKKEELSTTSENNRWGEREDLTFKPLNTDFFGKHGQKGQVENEGDGTRVALSYRERGKINLGLVIAQV